MKRTLLAFLLAPPIALAAGLLAAVRPLDLAALGALVALGLLSAYPIVLMLGLPALLLARRRGTPPLSLFVGVAIAAAVAVWLVAFWPPVTLESMPRGLDALLFGVAAAAAAACSFWLL